MTKKKDETKIDMRGKTRKTVKPGREQKVAELVRKNFNIVDNASQRKPPTKQDTEYVIELITECIEKCIDKNIMPNMRILAAYMRIDYVTMYRWIREETTPTAMYLKSVQNTLAGILEQGALSGDINNISAIFLLKSTHGYQEVNEMTVKIEDNNNIGMTREQIAERIDNDIIDVDVVEHDM